MQRGKIQLCFSAWSIKRCTGEDFPLIQKKGDVVRSTRNLEGLDCKKERVWENWWWLLNNGPGSLVFMLTETDVRGELKQLAGTGANAEVGVRARGRKTETRMMNLRYSYSEEHSWGEEDQSVKLRLLGMSAGVGARGQTEAGTSPPWQLTKWVLPRWKQWRSDAMVKFGEFGATPVQKIGEGKREQMKHHLCWCMRSSGGCLDRQLSDSQDKCLEIKAQGETQFEN